MKIFEMITISTLMLATMQGCQKDGDAFDKNGELQQKPGNPQAAAQGASAGTPTPSKPALTAMYDVFVRTKSGTNICKGQTRINVNSDFSLAFTESAMKCLSINVDLNKLLGSVTNSGSGGVLGSAGGGAKSDGKVLRIGKFGNSTFTPERPLLLGPVVQDARTFQGFFEEKPYQVVVANPGVAPVTSSGSIRLQVIGIDETYRPETYKGTATFNKVLHWKMEATGFNEINRAGSLLFDSLEFYWNTVPLAIPRIVISADLDDLTKGSVLGGDLGGLGGGIGSAIIGKLSIELSLVSHESL